MADKLVTGQTESLIDESQALWGPYWLDKDVGVIIFNDAGEDPNRSLTEDGGQNWSESEIRAGQSVAIACWFDRETPGDTGTLIHVVMADLTSSTIFYQTVDVTDGSLGTERTVDSGVTVDADTANNRLAITKTVNGNLLIAFSTQTEIECYRSVDAGENWTDRADVFEAVGESDVVLLFPADVDSGDACALYWDTSQNQISIKMYDDSANTWSLGTLIDSATADATQVNMDGAIRHSDSHLLMAFHSAAASAGDNFQTYDLTVDSVASPTVTSKGNLFSATNGNFLCAMLINQQNDDVYVAWQTGSPFTLVDTVFKKSTDGMGAWGSEQAYSENTADDLRRVQAGRTVGDDGGRYQPVFYNDDIFDIFVNLNNDIEFAPATEGLLVVVDNTIRMPGRNRSM